MLIQIALERIEILQKLRVHGRKPENAGPIFAKEVCESQVTLLDRKH